MAAVLSSEAFVVGFCMDLSGHDHFVRAGPLGQTMLAAGWAALASARAESLDIHLRGGQVIQAALAVRVDGRIAEASVQRGQWTHVFCIDDVTMVRIVPRGGRRSG